MTLNPFQRFLGVDESSDALTLLGLSHDRRTHVHIEAALRERLAKIYMHPDGRSDDAERVRQALRMVAEELKLSVHRHESDDAATMQRSMASNTSFSRLSALPAAPVLKLTTFDRLVMATLVGSKGWNAQSRARLVALAASYGVSVQGLMRVVQGLGDYARAGGARLGVREIMSDAPLTLYNPALSPGTPVGPALLDRLAGNLAAELQRDDPWPTIKLAAIFGVVTLIAGIIALRVALTSDPAPPSSPPTPSAVSTGGAGSSTISATDLAKRSVLPVVSPKPRIAQFAKPPSFLGNALPIEAVNAVDECPALADQIDELARKLTVADEPSEVVYRHWDVAINTIATGWVLADVSTRKEIDEAIYEALRAAADTPTVSDRLLKVFTPHSSSSTNGTLSEPLEVWRGAWKAGMLGKISSTNELPPVITHRARNQYELAMKEQPDALSFDAAVSAWLKAQLPQLVSSVEFDHRAFDYWELWIVALRKLPDREHRDGILMRAISALLATDTDLSRPGPSVNVLGRLIGIAWDDPSLIIKQELQRIFDNAVISNRDIWVLTSLLALSGSSPWFAEELVLPEDADQNHRWRIRDDIANAWPSMAPTDAQTPTRQPPAIDAAYTSRWQAISEKLLAQPLARGAQQQLNQLIWLSRLNEAADALVGQHFAQADVALESLESMLVSPAEGDIPASTNPSPGGVGVAGAKPIGLRVGQPIGRDGEFATAYRQLPKNTEQRVDFLRTLRTTAGTDLGLIDAELLVHEAYLGSPAEVRAVAQSVLSQQFSTGPIVAMELLDQFSDAPSSDAVSEMISSVTHAALPQRGSVAWAVEARLALTQHALRLRAEQSSVLDELAVSLRDSYVRRIALVGSHSELPSPQTPQEAAALLAAAWSTQAAKISAGSVAYDELPALQRRQGMRLQLADGPVQTMVAQQLAILDLITHITLAEHSDKPQVRQAATQILRASADVRSRLGSALEQVIEVERAIIRMLEVRMNTSQEASSTRETSP